MADFDAKRLQDEGGNNLNFVPTNFMEAQGNSKSIDVEFGKKQNTLSLEADSADISDNTTIVKTLDGVKLKTALAVKFWNYIKGKLGFNSSTNKYGISISGSADSAGKLNASAGGPSQPVYFPSSGIPTEIPLTELPANSGEHYLTIQVQGAYYATNAGTAGKLSNTSAIGSGNQPVYFTANGVPEVIPTQQVSIGGQQVAVLTLAVQTAFASEKATKDSDGNQINTTYLRKDVAEATYSRIVNVRSIEDHTYNLSGEDTDVTAFAINFAGYDSLPMNRPTMLLISLQYECAGGTSLGLKFKYGTTALGATSLPDGRHYVTLPVVWQAKHNVLDPNPFSLCFCGVSGKSVHVMSGSLVLM